MNKCEGPLIWYDVTFESAIMLSTETRIIKHAAILECKCGYIVASGNFHDEAHALTPLIRSVM